MFDNMFQRSQIKCIANLTLQFGKSYLNTLLMIFVSKASEYIMLSKFELQISLFETSLTEFGM